jgi:hypothetical protein
MLGQDPLFVHECLLNQFGCRQVVVYITKIVEPHVIELVVKGVAAHARNLSERWTIAVQDQAQISGISAKEYV